MNSIVKSTFKEWNSMIQYFLKQYQYQYGYLLTLANPTDHSYLIFEN